MGGQWRKGGGKGRKGKGGAKVTKFSELPEERKEEIRAKRAEKAAEEGRKIVSNVFYQGTLLKRTKWNGWIKPKNLMKMPPNVRAKISEMSASYLEKASEHGKD